MKWFRKKLVTVLAFALLFTALPTGVQAAPAGTSYTRDEFEHKYNALLSCAVAEYLIPAQPDDALVLNANMEVDKTAMTDNYTSGVINLPRLAAPYYYEIVEINQMPIAGVQEDYDLAVNRTLYPTLTWKENIPVNTSIKLSIMSESVTGALRNVEFTFVEEMPGYGTTLTDCSKDILINIIENPASVKVDGNTTFYPHALHKDSIVTSNFVVGFSPNFYGHITDLMRNAGTPSDIGFTGAKVFPYTRSYASVYSVKEAVAPYINGSDNGRPEMFAVFEPVGSGVAYDSNRGVVTTGSTISSTLNSEALGVYCICTGNNLEWFTIKDSIYTGDLNAVNLDSPAIVIDNNTEYKIEENLGKYGFKPCLEVNNSSSVFDLENYPTIKYVGSADTTYNLYRTALAFGGLQPNVATLQCKKPVDKYTLNMFYRTNDNEQFKLFNSSEVVVGTKADLNVKPSTYVALYTFDTWYTDQSFTTRADAQTIANTAKKGDVVNLYGKYNYTGGSYTVQFYNDYTQETSSSEFETRSQPTLPSAPTRPGYLFRNWQVVNTTAQSSGIVYDPATFQPQQGIKYLFKTFWDTQGVITNVVANQTEYYVGDYVDKAQLVVTVQTDNEGTVRNLNTDEFTVSPDKIESTGTNQVLVTYNATGATYPIKLTGKAVVPQSLSAKYNGADITVGNMVNKSDITCTVHYNNQTTENITDFTIAPTTITSAGGNVIRVIYGNLSTTVTVTGVKKTTSASGGSGYTGGGGYTGGSGGSVIPTPKPSQYGTTAKTLRSISASYRGGQLYVGDQISASDISVTATFLDNSTTTLSSTAFQYSPSYARNIGTNTITVTYGGKSSAFSIEVLETASLEQNNQDSTIVGVDESGNPIYNSTGGSSSSNSSGSRPLGSISSTGSVTSDKSTQLGNPLTGAGVSASDKGTSVGYLNGNNILTSRLYGSTTAVENDLDVLAEIRGAGETATSVTVDLFNGAGGNDITSEMLTLLASKDLTLYINMLNPDDKTQVVARWTLFGDALTGNETTFNPNVTFEVTDKGSDILTYMAILDGEYPNCADLIVYPATNTYASGEVIRVYTCGFDKSNAHLDKSFTWSDVRNEIVFDVVNNKRYCLSNAMSAYPEGSSLTEDISLPSIEEEAPTDTIVEPEEDFDWGDDTAVDWEIPTDVPEEKSGFPFVVIPIALVVIILAVAGVMLFVKLRKNPVATYSEDEYIDDGEIGDEELMDDTEADDMSEIGEDDSLSEDDYGPDIEDN